MIYYYAQISLIRNRGPVLIKIDVPNLDNHHPNYITAELTTGSSEVNTELILGQPDDLRTWYELDELHETEADALLAALKNALRLFMRQKAGVSVDSNGLWTLRQQLHRRDRSSAPAWTS